MSRFKNFMLKHLAVWLALVIGFAIGAIVLQTFSGWPNLKDNEWTNFWQVMGSGIGAAIGGYIAYRIAKYQSKSDRRAAIKNLLLQQIIGNANQIIQAVQNAGSSLDGLGKFLNEIHRNPSSRVKSDEGWNDSHEYIRKRILESGDEVNTIITSAYAQDFDYIDRGKIQSSFNDLSRVIAELDKNRSELNQVEFESNIQLAIYEIHSLQKMLSPVQEQTVVLQRTIYEEYLYE
ncbi:hypothetical protein ACRHK7_01175 [Weissella tructae]|uniref:hypothetical protein n=1 Tax=Weissella tructae TaxID=887702 RepID=UPI003D8A1AFE